MSFHDRAELGQLLRADYQAGVLDGGGGSLHPLKFALGLARAATQAGALIHGQSRATSISQDATGVTVTTAGGQVRADQLIIGGNAYSGGLLPWQHRRFMPIGSYIGATHPLGELAGQLIPSRAAVCDMNNLIDYYRLTPDQRLLFGGRATAGAARLDRLRATMRQRMAGVFPELAGEGFEYLWGGQVAMTASRAPQFGRLGSRVLYAQGYSGQGVALAGLAGKLMAEAVIGRSEGFDLFARLRHRPARRCRQRSERWRWAGTHCSTGGAEQEQQLSFRWWRPRWRCCGGRGSPASTGWSRCRPWLRLARRPATDWSAVPEPPVLRTIPE